MSSATYTEKSKGKVLRNGKRQWAHQLHQNRFHGYGILTEFCYGHMRTSKEARQSPAANKVGQRSSRFENEGRTKLIYPPIESFWELPDQEERKGFSWSKLNIKTMLSYTFKFRGSLNRTGRSESMRLVLEGAHDPKDEQLVQSFREMLFLEGHFPGKQNDYHTLLRFLRRRDFDLTKAKESYLEFLKWREEFDVDAIAKEFKFEEYEEVKRCYPHGFHGVDRYGRPLYIERIGMVNLDALLQVTSMDRFLKYHVSEQEKTLTRRYPACSLAAKKHIASTTSILDMKDVGVSNFSKPARYLFLEIQKIDSNYYPETLHRLYIINAGSGFRVLWKALKAFLDPRTLAKIQVSINSLYSSKHRPQFQVLGSNYRSNLIEAVDPRSLDSNLPSFLGGNCTCSDCGGCFLSDKGPWNDHEIKEMLQAMVDSEDEYSDGEDGGMAVNRTLASDEGDIQIKDADDIIPTADKGLGQLREAKGDKTSLQKIQAFEDALNNANKIMQGLALHIEELKKRTKWQAQLGL
ncbi:hypothetical protein RJ640_012842 [Escallonia rubra]|uniref:CRAL-TRIO domain-containing protein n=1 Tax=Escallonia rubra TaxID=112253 RepID=A0AA88QHI9_9ASTE|nr:hypothetical protein RJ640_012842 [Escallonia rubra]